MQNKRKMEMKIMFEFSSSACLCSAKCPDHNIKQTNDKGLMKDCHPSTWVAKFKNEQADNIPR